MKLLLLLATVVALASAQEFYTSTYYSDAACTTAVNAPVVFESGTCVVDPSPGTNRSAKFTFASATTYTQEASQFSQTCSLTVQTATYDNCACVMVPSFVVEAPYNYYRISPVGNGTAMCAPTTTMGPVTTTPAPVCFHESTRITYAGSEYSLAELALLPACHIPHQPTADGVSIRTVNGRRLRLTADHLVFTARGLVAAGEVHQGDVLFSDLAEQQPVEVESVAADKGQRYFGLNCLRSEVLADGFKTSTVGHYHLLPSLWFRYAGSLLGIERASRLGDHVVQALFKLRLLR